MHRYAATLSSTVTELAIDMCAVCGPTGLPTLTTQSCVNTGINERTVTCAAGYWAQGTGQAPPDPDVVLIGSAFFQGCAGKFRSTINSDVHRNQRVQSFRPSGYC